MSVLNKFTGWNLIEYWVPGETEYISFYDRKGDEVISVPLEELIVWYLNLNTFEDFIEFVLNKAKGVNK